MQADTNPMLERHAFLWQRLRDWVAEALRSHAYTLEYRTREQLTPLRIWLTLIENLLRRLILMAATTAKVDVQPQWRPEPKPEAPEDTPAESLVEPSEPDTPPAPKPNTSRFRFRLYGIHWPRKTNTGEAPTFTGAAPATATSTQVLFTIRICIQDPMLSVGERPKRRRKASAPRSKRPAWKRTRAPKHGPDLTIEDLLAWVQAQGDSGNLGDMAWQEMLADIERQNRADATYEAACASEPDWQDDEAEPECCDDSADESKATASPAQPDPQPDLISTQPLLDRLAAYAELINNRDKLIQRAARAFARRREIALRLSQLTVRKTTGLLAASRHLYGTLIPLDAEFRLAMEYFAVSYVECDSS